MFGIPMAAFAAGLFGIADFMGGYASRRLSPLMVTVIVSIVGALPVLAMSAFVGGTPTATDLAWGAAGGVSGSLGVTLLYHVLARGPVGVMAPVAAVCGVVVPVAAGIALGERPTPGGIAGMVLAAASVALVSASGGGRGPRIERSTITLAVLAGIGLGAFLVFLARVGPTAGLTPLLAARGAGAITAVVVIALRREPFALPAGARGVAVGAALVDGLANVLYLLVVRTHALSIAGTIVSLAPALTVLLGRVVLNERFHRRQLAGLALAALAVVLLTTG